MKVENAKDMADRLEIALGEWAEELRVDLSTSSFCEGGVLTGNEGFVVRFKDGNTFQVTVVKSR